MNNEQQPPKSHVNSNDLSPPVETDMEKSSGPSPPSRSTWRIIYRNYGPFILHFALTVIVATVCLCFLDGRAFNANSRRPQFQELTGNVTHVMSYAPLQSDITTAVSLAATATRLAGGWWATSYIWRCIFVVMERGGISAKGLLQVISNRPPAPRHFARKSNMVIIYITLFATFAIDYFSAALTGSVIWEATDELIPGSKSIYVASRAHSYWDMPDYFHNSGLREDIMSMGSASAIIAWGTLQSDLFNKKPSTIFRRVVREAVRLQNVSNNSTLNATMPYFAMEAFEWVQDPDQVLTDEQLPLFGDYSEFSPYFSPLGVGGLLPDRKWGPPFTTSAVWAPHIVSETRLFTFRIQRLVTPNRPCPQNYAVDPGLQINLHGYQTPGYTDCFAIANVTYRAGALKCDNCKIIAPTVLEAQAPFSVVGDSLTSLALGLAPSLGTNFLYNTYVIPNRETLSVRELAMELTSRAYQAAWVAFMDWCGEADVTIVKFALPTLRAKIVRWKVYLWVALHLWVLGLGLLFIYVQSHCDHPWVEDTTMAIFWLDTRAVPRKLADDQSVISDPWQPGVEIRDDGMLILALSETGWSGKVTNRDSGSS